MSRVVRRWIVALALLVPSAGARSALAQGAADTVPLFTAHDLVYVGVVAAGTAALLPLDRSIARDAQRPGLQGSHFARHLAADARVAGVPGTLVAGAALYAVGRLGHHDRLTDLGLHGLEAIASAEVVGWGIKGIAGRARPFVVADTRPYDFRFGRGFGDDRHASFPSGHTLAAFAAASVVSEEMSRWHSNARWYVTPAAYGGATLVALSRLYNDQHWASDVFLAAGIGTFTGMKVVRFNHRAHPGNAIDRWLLSASVAPAAGGGMAVGWRVETR